MKLFNLAAALSLAAFIGAGSAQAGQKLIVAVEGAFPPYNQVAADGSLQGFDVDMAKEICKKIEADCQFVKQDWDGMIPALIAKKFDVIISSMGILPDREKKVDFTIPYYQAPTALLALKTAGVAAGADGYVDGNTLAGKRVGVQRATAYESFARKFWPKAEIVIYDSAQTADLDFQNGRIDARFDDYIELKENLMKSEMKDQVTIIGKIYGEKEFGSKGEGIAVRKGEDQLRESISKAILAMRQDGTYKAINDKYFDFDIYGQ
jgi:polar amino acid transport system substrate-binding protein